MGSGVGVHKHADDLIKRHRVSIGILVYTASTKFGDRVFGFHGTYKEPFRMLALRSRCE